jgi:hypothetical protein
MFRPRTFLSPNEKPTDRLDNGPLVEFVSDVNSRGNQGEAYSAGNAVAAPAARTANKAFLNNMVIKKLIRQTHECDEE